jgi:hypothetical protein
VLADQFLYYAQGFSRLRVAPDVMVIFDIPQQPYDNYKIWETGKIPSIIFEMTSESTQAHDQVNGFPKNYAAIVVKLICQRRKKIHWFMRRSLMA